MIDKKMIFADDATESPWLLLRLRLPWLLVGLLGGMIASRLVAGFEEALAQHISLAFFLPVIVYMSDAVGSQTETIYVRNASKGKLSLWVYLGKELVVGLVLGVIFGILLWAFALLWLQDTQIAFTIGLAMFVNIVIAPVLGVIVPAILQREHSDPALGSGPFTTILQDIISLLIYFGIAAYILF